MKCLEICLTRPALLWQTNKLFTQSKRSSIHCFTCDLDVRVALRCSCRRWTRCDYLKATFSQLWTSEWSARIGDQIRNSLIQTKFRIGISLKMNQLTRWSVQQSASRLSDCQVSNGTHQSSLSLGALQSFCLNWQPQANRELSIESCQETFESSPIGAITVSPELQ